jgi:predicted adenylyl cyclase CyaB
MQNIEFKAELKDLPLARSIVHALGARYIAILDQTDTYYHLPEVVKIGGGRLKKRQTVGEATEWIVYERPDQASAKVSSFKIHSEEEAAARFDIASLRERVIVKKTRELHILGEVRIHLDLVQGLGAFVEFEALVSARLDAAAAHRAVAMLRRDLSPALGEPISVGYADLLEIGA